MFPPLGLRSRGCGSRDNGRVVWVGGQGFFFSSLEGGAPVVGVEFSVYPEMAALAGGEEMGWNCAERLALA